jgi:ABC-type uncharacterized transport system ATPase subunit
MLSGAEIDDWDDPGRPRTLLTVDRIGKRFQGARRWFWAKPQSFCPLSSASFEVAGGEIVGIVGAAGSGKSVLARILAGEMAADWGSLCLEGEPLGGPGLALDRYRRAIRLVTGDDEVAAWKLDRHTRVVVFDGDAAVGGVLRTMSRSDGFGCIALVRDPSALAGIADLTLRLADGRLSNVAIGRAA